MLNLYQGQEDGSYYMASSLILNTKLFQITTFTLNVKHFKRNQIKILRWYKN